jgi:hypothetical protein
MIIFLLFVEKVTLLECPLSTSSQADCVTAATDCNCSWIADDVRVAIMS